MGSAVATTIVPKWLRTDALALDTDADMAEKGEHLIFCAITIDIIIVMIFCFFFSDGGALAAVQASIAPKLFAMASHSQPFKRL